MIRGTVISSGIPLTITSSFGKRIIRTLLSCFAWTFCVSLLFPTTCVRADIHPLNPDSKTYQQCVAGCQSKSGEWKKYALTAEYLNQSCEETCASVDNELRDISITALNSDTGKPLAPILSLYKEGDSSPDVRGGFSGDTTYANMKEGTYTIEVTLPDMFRPETVTVRVVPSEKKDYDIVVRMSPLEKSDSPGKYDAYDQKCKKQRFCRDSSLHEGVSYDPLTAECTYAVTKCSKGCDPAGDRCLGSELQILEITFNPPDKPLLLNGSEKIVVTGNAVIDNPNNEPVGGQRFPVLAKVGDRTRPGTFGVRVFSGILDESGRFQVEVRSESKVSPSLPVDNMMLSIWPKDTPGTPVSLPLLSPAPKILSIKPLGKTELAWQESYKVFEVNVEDPDGNVDFYTVIPESGTIRYDGLDWEGYSQKNLYAYSKEHQKQMKFGWMAPNTTEYIELELTKKIYQEWENAGKKVLIKTADDYLTDEVSARYGNKIASQLPSLSEADTYVENLDADPNSPGYIPYASEWELVKFAAKLKTGNIKLRKFGDAIESGYKTVANVHKHTSDQAFKMGQADLVDNEFADYEKAFRLGSILLDGARLIDDAIDFALDVGEAAGVQGEKMPLQYKLLLHAKKAALMATVGTLQHTFEHAADTFKAGRAEVKTSSVQLVVAVTDKDGYRDMKGIFVEVQGYETLIKY